MVKEHRHGTVVEISGSIEHDRRMEEGGFAPESLRAENEFR